MRPGTVLFFICFQQREGSVSQKTVTTTRLALPGNACFQPKVRLYSIPNFDVCSNLLHQPLLCRIIWCILKSEHNCWGTKLLLFPRRQKLGVCGNPSSPQDSTFSPQTWIPLASTPLPGGRASVDPCVTGTR